MLVRTDRPTWKKEECETESTTALTGMLLLLFYFILNSCLHEVVANESSLNRAAGSPAWPRRLRSENDLLPLTTQSSLPNLCSNAKSPSARPFHSITDANLLGRDEVACDGRKRQGWMEVADRRMAQCSKLARPT